MPLPLPLAAELVGYGARGGTGVDAKGAGVHRTAAIQLSDRTPEVMITEQCLTTTIGGAYVLETEGGTQGGAAQLCAFGGDLGSPAMYRSAEDGKWYVLGIGSQSDASPCSDTQSFFTSVQFREEWIQGALSDLIGAAPVVCPSASPSPTPTQRSNPPPPSQSPMPTPNPTTTPSPTPVVP